MPRREALFFFDPPPPPPRGAGEPPPHPPPVTPEITATECADALCTSREGFLKHLSVDTAILMRYH